MDSASGSVYATAHLASYKRAADQQAADTRAGLGQRRPVLASTATGPNSAGAAALAGLVSMLRESAAPPGDCP